MLQKIVYLQLVPVLHHMSMLMRVQQKIWNIMWIQCQFQVTRICQLKLMGKCRFGRKIQEKYQEGNNFSLIFCNKFDSNSLTLLFQLFFLFSGGLGRKALIFDLIYIWNPFTFYHLQTLKGFDYRAFIHDVSEE